MDENEEIETYRNSSNCNEFHDDEDSDMKNNNSTSTHFSTYNVYDANSDNKFSMETINNETNSGEPEEELSVDFVLVYKESDNEYHDIREYYEKQLTETGLKLSTEQEDNLYYVKIHAPIDVLCQYCEIMKMRMPIRNIPGLNVKQKPNLMRAAVVNISNLIGDKTIDKDNEKSKYKWTAEFSIEKDYLFDVYAKDFFSPADKCMIINFILERAQFSEDALDVGMAKLLNDNVYKAAYPLHDGGTKDHGTQRHFFYNHWATVTKMYKFQPLDQIKSYFGVKFGLYFAWLGFYTLMLIPASIVGVLCTVYGWWTLPEDEMSADVCSPEMNFTMCPQCDKKCDYWDSTEACTYSKIIHLFDNYGTYAFTIFMSIWSALYLEFWKRYCAEINHRWGLSDYDLDSEHPRPQYLAKFANAKKKFNYVTNREEPVVPFCTIKLPTMVISFSFALIWVSLAVIAVFGVVIYRMTGIAADIIFTDDSSPFTSFIVPVTAAIINLICIFLLNIVYNHLALILTEHEHHRTQAEFDDSLTLKIYMFQFVNYYSSIFYVAFLKGKLVGYPNKYNRLFGYRQEECNFGECLMELFIQLAIIMIGKQTLNAVIEYGVPKIKAYMARRKSQDDNEENIRTDSMKQWVEDLKLSGLDSKGMFSEYLEMVIQYGFVTIFVTAFPLAPLFALINNIFEMRLDAKKYVKYYRRPINERVKNIGIWMYIIEMIGKLSIISNAFIIAFSSNFIPVMVYNSQFPGMGERGFLNYSLSYFNVKDFEEGAAPSSTKYNVTECRYPDYRNPYWERDGIKYKRSLTYWNILAARFAFVVVYQNIVGFTVMIVQWIIPDIPKKLTSQIKRQTLLVNQYIIKQEQFRAKSKRRI